MYVILADLSEQVNSSQEESWHLKYLFSLWKKINVLLILQELGMLECIPTVTRVTGYCIQYLGLAASESQVQT